MSCDNIQGNGDLAHDMITAFATMRDEELGFWIGEYVAFPNSMVDRITPATTDADRELVATEHGIDDAWRSCASRSPSGPWRTASRRVVPSSSASGCRWSRTWSRSS
jgi:hypothetical protein